MKTLLSWGQFSAHAFPFIPLETGVPGASDGADTAAPLVNKCKKSEAPVVSLGQGCQGSEWSSRVSRLSPRFIASLC